MPPAIGFVLVIFLIFVFVSLLAYINRSKNKDSSLPVYEVQKIKILKTLYTLAYDLDKNIIFVQVEKFKVIEKINMFPATFNHVVQQLVAEDIVTEATEDTIAFTEFGLKYYSNIVIGK